MPIYEYYCPENHTIYQFYAKTLAQGQTVPRCPDNPAYTMRKRVSAFAITRGGNAGEAAEDPASPDSGAEADDPKLEAAMDTMEREFSGVDENDPRAMARMMRRMADLTGERLDEQMEEVVRKLEEGVDPEAIESEFGDDAGGGEGDDGEGGEPGAMKEPKERRHRFRLRRAAPRRDPKLYDYD